MECLTNICTFLFIKTSIVKNLSSMRTRLFLCEGGLPETQNNSRNGTDDGTERKWNGKCCDLHVWDTDHSVADLRGTRDARSPRGPNSFNFTQFLGKFGKIVCWRPPPPESWRPHLREILGPPLHWTLIIRKHTKFCQCPVIMRNRFRNSPILEEGVAGGQ